MLLECVRFVLCMLLTLLCGGDVNIVQGYHQTLGYRDYYATTTKPVPFPTCQAIDIGCQKKGLRTFFFLMDSGHLGMKPIDPIILDSIALSFPDQQLRILLRKLNVTGARWTRLLDRKFDLPGFKSGVKFLSDLHLTSEIIMNVPDRSEPYVSYITMDLLDVESNITYSWGAERRIDHEEYLLIGYERIAIRNTRLPTFFLQPESLEASSIEETIQARPAILDHISNEVVTAVMHTVIDNFRLFASKVPAKYYYKYY